MMSTSSKTKQLAVDTILFGISTFGSKILVFLLTPLYTAVLLTEEYGIADLINTTVNLIYPVLTLAITDATLRYSLDKDCSKRAVLGNSIVITNFFSIKMPNKNTPFFKLSVEMYTADIIRFCKYKICF